MPGRDERCGKIGPNKMGQVPRVRDEVDARLGRQMGYIAPVKDPIGGSEDDRDGAGRGCNVGRGVDLLPAIPRDRFGQPGPYGEAREMLGQLLCNGCVGDRSAVQKGQHCLQCLCGTGLCHTCQKVCRDRSP